MTRIKEHIFFKKDNFVKKDIWNRQKNKLLNFYNEFLFNRF